MDIIIHWGVLTHLRKDVKANAAIVTTAIILDAVVLGAFLWVKSKSDILVVIVSFSLMALIFIAEHWFLKTRRESGEDE